MPRWLVFGVQSNIRLTVVDLLALAKVVAPPNGSPADGTRRADPRTAPQEPVPNVADADVPSASQFVEKARRAEENGKRSLALAYFRTARDLGSEEAREEIERLSPTKPTKRYSYRAGFDPHDNGIGSEDVVKSAGCQQTSINAPK